MVKGQGSDLEVSSFKGWKQILEPQVRTLNENEEDIRRKKRFKGFLPRL